MFHSLEPTSSPLLDLQCLSHFWPQKKTYCALCLLLFPNIHWASSRVYIFSLHFRSPLICPLCPVESTAVPGTGVCVCVCVCVCVSGTLSAGVQEKASHSDAFEASGVGFPASGPPSPLLPSRAELLTNSQVLFLRFESVTSSATDSR